VVCGISQFYWLGYYFTRNAYQFECAHFHRCLWKASQPGAKGSPVGAACFAQWQCRGGNGDLLLLERKFLVLLHNVCLVCYHGDDMSDYHFFLFEVE
jgi:hypothetical protein